MYYYITEAKKVNSAFLPEIKVNADKFGVDVRVQRNSMDEYGCIDIQFTSEGTGTEAEDRIIDMICWLKNTYDYTAA